MNDLEQNLTQILNDKNTYLLPENLKKGITCLGVEGTLDANQDNNIKLFSSVENMNNDPNAKENDLAVVYYSSIQNGTAQTEFTTINFPETVVLPEAFTSSVYCMFRSDSGMGDGNVMLDQSSFRFDYWGENMIRISYTSSDGITYTKQEGDNQVTFENPIKCYMEDEWNDTIGYFMQTGGYNFDGLYEYVTEKDTNQIGFIDMVDITFDINDSAINNVKYNGTINRLLKVTDIKTILQNISAKYEYAFPGYGYFGFKDNKLKVWVGIRTDSNTISGYNMNIVRYDANKNIIGLNSGSSFTDLALLVFDIDLDTLDYTNTTIINKNTDDYYDFIIDTVPIIIQIQNDITYITSIGVIKIDNTSYSLSNILTTNDFLVDISHYIIAPTQFNAKQNDLLPNKSAYSNNGAIKGDNSIYNNLDSVEAIKSITGIDPSNGYLTYLTDIPDECIKQLTYIPEYTKGCVCHYNLLLDIDSKPLLNTLNDTLGTSYSSLFNIIPYNSTGHILSLDNDNILIDVEFKTTNYNRYLVVLDFNGKLISKTELFTNRSKSSYSRSPTLITTNYIYVSSYYQGSTTSDYKFVVWKIDKNNGSLLETSATFDVPFYKDTALRLFNDRLVFCGTTQGSIQFGYISSNMKTITTSSSNITTGYLNDSFNVYINDIMSVSDGLITLYRAVNTTNSVTSCQYYLIKFNGSSSLIVKNISSYKDTTYSTNDRDKTLLRGFTVQNDIIYTSGKNNTVSFDKDLNLLSTTGTISAFYNDINMFNYKFTDYLNYQYDIMDIGNNNGNSVRVLVKNGQLSVIRNAINLLFYDNYKYMSGAENLKYLYNYFQGAINSNLIGLDNLVYANLTNIQSGGCCALIYKPKNDNSGSNWPVAITCNNVSIIEGDEK